MDSRHLREPEREARMSWLYNGGIPECWAAVLRKSSGLEPLRRNRMGSSEVVEQESNTNESPAP